ncbi:kinase-like domain-containing protein [Aspergillus ambiguus]|uniref:kinase-like domain-containing protein n=1 Tax=Aspergillus ambiguus TaxID=176160 RepID=UPI003CCC94C8
MSSPFLDTRGNTIPLKHVLGNGGTAIVLLQNDVAIKAPLRYIWSSDYDVEANLKSIRREQAVYSRLQSSKDDRSDGVVHCLGFSPEATRLAYMRNGDLQTYLTKYRPSLHLQLTWFRGMARTLSYIHDQRVLVTDIASRNFLLDSDLSIKFCDFSEASLLPLDSKMETADDNGYTIQIDIGLLGKVMYEIVTGDKCEVDLYKDNAPTDGRAYWPDKKSLPSTQGIWLGEIIEGCWVGKFRSAHSLLLALNSVDLPWQLHSLATSFQSRIL